MLGGVGSVLGGVCVAHLFSFLYYACFPLASVLCLGHGVASVLVDCPFLIVPSVYTNVYYVNNTLHKL